MASRIHPLFSYISALAALLLWGGWAYVVNGSDNAHATGLTAALVQGSASFVITLLMVRAVTWLHAHIAPGGLQAWLPAVITITCTGSVLVTAHSLAGTPHIFRTIAPALLVGLVFCLFTSHALRKAESNHALHKAKSNHG